MSTYARNTNVSSERSRGDGGLVSRAIANGLSLSWAAGLFEGEGTASITRSGRRGYTRPLISLTSTDSNMIQRLHMRWPGCIRTFQPKGNAKLAHTWTLNARRSIARFIFDVVPFIRTERVRRKMWLVWDDIGARIQGPGSPGYLAACHTRREQIHALNRRGTSAAIDNAYKTGKMPSLLGWEGKR